MSFVEREEVMALNEKILLSVFLMTRMSPFIPLRAGFLTKGHVGAKYEIYTIMTRLVEQGMSIIMISSELPEVIRLADRVLVMREGRISATLNPGGITEANIARNAIPA